MTPLTDKPKALDLFCKAGGASMGLYLAGFDVTGVDIEPQPRYPFTFVQADAMEVSLDGFDFIWASPPCQGYSRLRHLPWLKGRQWPMLIDECRAKLIHAHLPAVIENVEDSPLDGIVLCGQMFGLPIYRHRKFEPIGFFALQPAHVSHSQVIGHGRMVNDRRKGTLNAGSAKGAWTTGQPIITVAGGQFKKSDGEKALQIDWMSKDELAQAIPPKYSEFIGRQAMQFLEARELCI